MTESLAIKAIPAILTILLAVAENREATESGLQEKSGRIVYHWPEEKQENQAKVVVYALPRDFRTYPWKVAD